jgi:D-psicose/D-tagatose/L-ribulose 3-epimerase
MKLAISNIAWNLEEDDEIRELLVAFGAAGVEVAPTKVWCDPACVDDEAIVSYRRVWNECEISIPALQALLFGRPELRIFGTETQREDTLHRLCSMMRVGALLGAKVLVFGSPRNRTVGELGPEAALEIAVPFFRRAGEAASALGVVLCIEPNPPQYGCDFINTLDEAARLVRAVGCSGFRLHADASAMILNGENAARSLSDVADCMAYFHISDPYLKVPGAHREAHRQIAAALRASGWNQWVSIEMLGQPGSVNRQAIEQALRFASEVYLA